MAFYYKDAQGGLHFLESTDYEFLLPAGCVAISEAEAEAIRLSQRTPAEKNAPLIEQLAVIDVKKTRAMTDALLTGDKTRLQTLEAEAVALRGQLVA